jgi:hypothetical protein
MTTYVFEKVQLKRKVSYSCPVCKKPRSKVLAEFQTLNPFNLGKDGEPKVRFHILIELEATLDKAEKAFKVRPPRCTQCT